MKKYNKPAIEICSFDVKDIITISGEATDINNEGTYAKQAYDDFTTKSADFASTSVSVFKW